MSKAEGVLLLVKTALKNGETAELLQKTMADFYRLIPHKHPASEEVNLRLLAQKEDLCQVQPWNKELGLKCVARS